MVPRTGERDGGCWKGKGAPRRRLSGRARGGRATSAARPGRASGAAPPRSWWGLSRGARLFIHLRRPRGGGRVLFGPGSCRFDPHAWWSVLARLAQCRMSHISLLPLPRSLPFPPAAAWRRQPRCAGRRGVASWLAVAGQRSSSLVQLVPGSLRGAADEACRRFSWGSRCVPLFAGPLFRRAPGGHCRLSPFL